jgi:hypothetical protein
MQTAEKKSCKLKIPPAPVNFLMVGLGNVARVKTQQIAQLGNVARVKKSAQNHSPSARVSRAFLNSRNIPACLDQAIQTRKP